MTAGFSEGRVLGRRDWASGLMTLRIAAETEPFDAGQFVNLGLFFNGHFVRRAYSMASSPGSDLEFYLTLVSGGDLTPALFELKPGDAVWVERKPQGFFTLRYVPECREMWFVATGTGLGPFVALLRTPEPWRRFERIILVHGVREAQHLSYRDEFDSLSKQHGNRLNWVPVVSREVVPGAVHGRITTALVNGTLEQAAGVPLDAERSHVMLCGNPAMIEEVMLLLKERGLRKHRVRQPGHITTEKYW